MREKRRVKTGENGSNKITKHDMNNPFRQRGHMVGMRLCTCQGKGVGRQSPLAGPALSPAL